MVVRKESWPAGTPAWVDISVSDPARSRAFYAAVLGWEFTEGGEQYGGYFNALVNGETAAGLGPVMPGQEDAPHVWTTYLAVEDSQATAEAVGAAGGQVLLPPMEVGPFGTMAIHVDPTGAAFGTWQSGEHTGCDIANEPGAVVWNEAMVGDFEAGKAFYAQVFGYDYADMSSPEMRYATFSVGEQMAGGIGQVSAGSPARWDVTFGVADVDLSAQQVRDHGGSVLTEPYDMEWGRIAIVTGPDGEAFGMMAAVPAG